MQIQMELSTKDALLKWRSTIENYARFTAVYYKYTASDIDDFVQECYLDFLTYYPKLFDSKKASLSTYIYLRCKYKMYHLITKDYRRAGILLKNSHIVEESLKTIEAMFGEDQYENAPVTPIDIEEYFSCKHLTEEELKLLKLYYVGHWSAMDIAREYKCSASRVYQILDEGTQKISDYFNINKTVRSEEDD